MSDVFKVVKAWSDNLVLQVDSSSSDAHSYTAYVNGEKYILEKTEVAGLIDKNAENSSLWKLNYDLMTSRIAEFSVRRDDGVVLSNATDFDKSIFLDSDKLISDQIQNRGLQAGRGLRYSGALQGYLWCQANRETLTRGNYIRLSSYCLCCCIYRLMQLASSKEFEDSQIIFDRIERLVASFERHQLTADEARWMPSLLFSAAQLHLCHNQYDKAVSMLIEILDKMDVCLELAPITAYNLSLANCLLCALLISQQDKRAEDYKEKWEKIFRRYPVLMEIRIGTMIEFQDIYNACLLNHRIYNQFWFKGTMDRRFKKVTSAEILDSCLRSDPPPITRRMIAEKYLSAF